MSTHIDHWTTFVVENLVMPFEFDERDIRWHRDSNVLIHLCESGGIMGLVKGDLLYVSAIGLTFSGSGQAYVDVCKLLRRSTGTLKAFVIWEGGTPNFLSVVDGKLKEYPLTEALLPKVLEWLEKEGQDGADAEGG